MQCHLECKHDKPLTLSSLLLLCLTWSYLCPRREDCSSWSVHPSANWLCISSWHPLPRPYHALLQVHAGKAALLLPLHSTPFFIVKWVQHVKNSVFCSLYLPASMTETKIPDPVESYRGHPWKQLRVHWPYPATIRSPVGVSSKQLAFWWAPCTPSWKSSAACASMISYYFWITEMHVLVFMPWV